MDEVYAEEDFRWGVIAFHNGFYNNAILSFEKALSLSPDSALTRTWLGRAFYKSGLEQLALNEWNYISTNNQASSVLNSWIQSINYRRSIVQEIEEDERYIIISEIDANDENYHQFRRPISIEPTNDGSFFLVAFASNEILRIDANHNVTNVYRGSLFQNFDHPYDVLNIDDEYMFVSEYLGNFISKYTFNGIRLLTIGNTGSGAGELLGPQYLAQDGKGYIYVTDYGNKRVNKYDYDGNFILSFGRRTSFFPGFTEPTGIAISNDMIYVADRQKKAIFIFDLSGNYIRSIADGELIAPEGIFFKDSNTILIADTERLIEFNIEQETLYSFEDLENYAERLINVGVDSNNNILTIDFDQNKVFLLAEMSNLYTGLFVQTERISANNYPEIVIDVSVTDKDGSPIVGLKADNFYITENHNSVRDYELLLTNQSATQLTILILVEKSLSAMSNKAQIEEAVEDIFNIFNEDARIILVSAGETPAVELKENISRLRLVDAATDGNYSDNWRFDLGIRNSVSELVALRGRKSIIYISQGGIGSNPYKDYDLLEITQYLKNNSIDFNTIYFNQTNLHPDISYLSDTTGGNSTFYFQIEGLNNLRSELLSFIPSVYTFKYISPSYSDFGREYIPVEIEVNLMNRSGRDECGYFAPLEY